MTDEKDQETMSQVTKGLESFSVDFHKSVAGKTDGNFVGSALSAHVVLSMAAYGAEGNTAKEMRQALRLPGDDAHAHQAFRSFIQNLNSVQNVILNVANKIYASHLINVKDRFKEITGSYFHSESETIDFSKNAEAAKTINQWCVDKTNGKIEKIVEPGDLGSLTGMILLNAVYFKGKWEKPFDKSATEDRPFHVNRTTTVKVPTMFIETEFFYKDLKDLDAECVALPYKNPDVVMVILVPKQIDGLAKLEQNLEKLELNLTRDLRRSKRKIQLSLPKFKVETTIDLNTHLSEMGMKEMFCREKANFKSISDTFLFVDKVRQKAFIEVNEEGSEAAAVTAVKLMMRCMPLPPFEVTVDKPFLFKIVRDNDTLFSGRVTNPIGN